MPKPPNLVQVAVLLTFLFARPAAAEAPAFDLAGPALRVTVEHDGVRLPIAQVPSLAEGDLLTVRADLPATQGAPYLLITAFLRGATNPPPREWFARAETWTTKGAAGVTVRVPAGARQALIFLAPRTPGDFATVSGAVRGRPGAFVRASQDLMQASLDRSRLTTFLAALRRSEAAGADDLKITSPLLARSLDLKLNPECLLKAPDLQAACLLQGRDALVLSDGHSRSIVEALTSGSASDLALHLSAAPAAGYGASSAYVGAVLDIARLLDSLRTSQFQYIPALAEARDDRLSLVLNTPPSFQNPRSVLVAALPPVNVASAPLLHAVDPGESFCLARADLVLPVTGAPLVYSTALAHDLVLHAFSPDGRSVDLPVTADPGRGGLVVSDPAHAAATLHGPLAGALRGRWGFEPFEGPVLLLQGVRDAPWVLADGDGVVVGRDAQLRLDGPSACVDQVRLQLGAAAPRAVFWKPAGPGAVTVTVPLSDAHPGSAALLVRQHGSDREQSTGLKLFNEAARLDGFTVHVGDGFGVLTGSRLDEVSTLTFSNVTYTPATLVSSGGKDELTLNVSDRTAAAHLAVGGAFAARITLKDGRTLRIEAAVQGARLQTSIISMSQDAAESAGPLRLPPDELRRGAQLTFSVRRDASSPAGGPLSMEVALPGGVSPVTLTSARGLTEVDAGVLVARLDTADQFGSSAYGPLRFRVVQGGVASDWRPLTTLVRTPTLRRLRCPEIASRPCEMDGDDLFLIDAVSADPTFRAFTSVPPGFTGRVLIVPHPRSPGRLYVRLHDDPERPAMVVF